MRRLRALAIGLALLTAGAWPIAGAAAPACAIGAPHAALVIDTGTAVHTYCVQLDAPVVDGLHLIELAGAQQGLVYRFGLGGAAVCRLAGVGVGGDDCFADYPAYWGYWHGDGLGGWAWASVGGGGSQVRDGDVEGWVWGEGDTGVTHAAPPPTAIADVCAPAPSPTPAAAPSESTSATTTVAPHSTRTTGGTAPANQPSDGSAPGSGAAAPTTSVPAVVVAAAPRGPDPGGGGGPPAGLFLGIGMASLLGAAGALRLRARKLAG